MKDKRPRPSDLSGKHYRLTWRKVRYGFLKLKYGWAGDVFNVQGRRIGMILQSKD